jgi:hypothetical protein
MCFLIGIQKNLPVKTGRGRDLDYSKEKDFKNVSASAESENPTVTSKF